MVDKPKTTYYDQVKSSVHLHQRTLSQVGNKQKIIWAIGGGKGGVGKTLITANLGIYLSWLKKKVALIDLDLGGANLHTSLGVATPGSTLSDFVIGKTSRLEDLLTETYHPNLQLISGAHDATQITLMRQTDKRRLLDQIKQLPADFILLDLGAGTTMSTLDFFLLADQKIVVITPEPTSIENGYRFIRASFYRLLLTTINDEPSRKLIQEAMEQNNENCRYTPQELMTELKEMLPENELSKLDLIHNFVVSLVVNQTRFRSEDDIGKSIQLVCHKYFGMNINYMGSMAYDNSIWQSIKNRKPFLINSPNSQAVTHLESLLRNLIRFHIPENQR